MGCGSGGGCESCNKSEKRGCGVSSVFDWLYQIDKPQTDNRNLVEVQFKGDRKDFYLKQEGLNLSLGDVVAVEGGKSGHDIGKVSMTGELVALQIARKNRDINKDPLKKIYRIATETDTKKWTRAIEAEGLILEKAKRIIEDFNLEMKLSDVEFQGDNTKATFFYTAERRVDFRELIREYSSRFKVKVEMRQIGARQEAAKIGGLGSCGRELCCSTWMTNFPSVSTSAARYQQLSINPQKISGQCGRLKCCLNFELDGYAEALKEFPNSKTQLKTKKGTAKFIKLDVFKKTMFYLNPENPNSDLLEMTINQVKEIIEQNKNGKIPESLAEFITEIKTTELSFEDAMGQDNINRFDTKKQKKKKKKTRNKRINLSKRQASQQSKSEKDA